MIATITIEHAYPAGMAVAVAAAMAALASLLPKEPGQVLVFGRIQGRRMIVRANIQPAKEEA